MATNSKKQIESGRTLAIRIGTALERLMGGGGEEEGRGLNRFYVITTIALGSAVVHKHVSYSDHVKDF